MTQDDDDAPRDGQDEVPSMSAGMVSRHIHLINHY